MAVRFNVAFQAYSKWHFKAFNFLTRRIVAPAFVLGGAVIAAFHLQGLLPGGTVQVNGVPDDDLVLRAAAVLLPLLVSVLGIALYRARPYEPPSVAERGDA